MEIYFGAFCARIYPGFSTRCYGLRHRYSAAAPSHRAAHRFQNFYQQFLNFIKQITLPLKQNIKIINELIEQLEKKLGLNFIEKEGGNLCMANRNSELRQEFKQSFTLDDIQFYIKAVQQKNGAALPLPENETIFLTLVKKGKQI